MSGRRFGIQRMDERTRTRAAFLRAEALEDRQLLATFTVSNVNDAGAGSLRAAITSANATPGADVIEFGIGGSGVRSINLLTPLPAIADVLTIDGTTQPGQPLAGTPLIELNGASAGNAASGLRLSAATTVRALAINRFADSGIRIESAGNIIEGCHIGTDASGNADFGNSGDGITIDRATNNTIGGSTAGRGNVISGNGGDGISIEGGANANVVTGNRIGTNVTGTAAIPNTFNGVSITSSSANSIGGLLLAERNIISGNGFDGIGITFSNAINNTIRNNYIGTDAAGSAAIPNGFDGIDIFVSDRNTIGGTVPEAANLISGNNGIGVRIQSSDGTTIQGNRIGSGADGVSPLGNLQEGVWLFGFCVGNAIGGTATGAGNVIAYNGATLDRPGVSIVSGLSISNSILSNSIHSNFGLGIDLNADSVPNPNDPGDLDLGANNLQNHPIITTAKVGAGQTLIQGILSSTPSTTFIVQFFSSDSPDPSGFGEGQFYLGSIDVTTDGTGNGSFDFTIPSVARVGQFLTATATSPNLDTSEFSPATQIQTGTVSDLSITMTDSLDPAIINVPFTYTLTVVNNGPNDADNVAVTSFLPNSFSFVNATSTLGGVVQQAGSSVLVTFTRIRAGQTATITITVLPTQTGLFTNRATVSFTDIDADPTNNQATETTQVNVPIDLQLFIEDRELPNIEPEPIPTVVFAGQDLEYRILVINNGPGPANNSVLTATLSAGTVVKSSSTGQGTITQVGNTVLVDLGILNPDVPAAVRLVVTPGDGGTTNITATVSASEIDVVPGNETVSLDTEVLPSADLVIGLSQLPNQQPPAYVLTGQTFTYVYTLRNDGPSAANDLLVSLNLPAGVSLVSGSVGGGLGTVVANGPSVIASIPALASGASTTLMLDLLASDTAPNLISTTAVLSSQITDPDSSGNQVAISTPFNPANLGVTLTGFPLAAASGTLVEYNLEVVNSGPSFARSPVLEVSLPENLDPALVTIVQSPVPLPPLTGSSFTARLNPLGISERALIRFTVLVPAGFQQIVTTATASLDDQNDPSTPDQADIDLSNNVSTSTVSVDEVDLALEIIPPVGPIGLGGEATFLFRVANFGPFPARNITVLNPMPAGATLVSVLPLDNVLAIAQIGTTLAASVPVLAPSTPLAPIYAVFQVTYRVNSLGNFETTGSAQIEQADSNLANNAANASVPVVTLPGVAEFAQAAYTTSDRGPGLQVTVRRVNGNAGIVTVGYNTIGGTAVAGVDYSPVSGTLTFFEGETSKSFFLPVIANTAVTGDRTVTLLLFDTGSGVGAQSATTVTITDSDVDLIGPQVRDVQFNGEARFVSSVALIFDDLLDPVSAQNPANYTIRAPGSGPGGSIGIASVNYNANTRSVVITPTGPLTTGGFYTIVVNGSTPEGLRDRWGNLLDGDANNVSGGDFVSTFARGTSISYGDRDADAVSLRLTGGGYFDLVRRSDGQASILRILRATPRSVMNGSVRRARGGDGRAHLGDVYGLGSFSGGATSRLVTPPFTANSTLPSASVARSFGVRRIPTAGRLRG